MQRQYRRYFIILETEDKESGVVKGESPKGHGKIEVRNNEGILTINCINLKKRSSRERYRWYLINTNKEEEPIIVEIGPMEVDEKGKGEVVWEFNAENVRGSRELIDDFNVLVLAVQNKDKKNNLLVPLIGHMDKEKSTSWRYALEKHLYIPRKTEKKPKDQPKEDVKAKKEELDSKEYIENIWPPKDREYIPIKEMPVEEKISKEETVKDEILEEEIVKDEMLEEEIVKDEMLEEETVKDEILEEEIVEKEAGDPLNLEDPLEFSRQMQGYIENALEEFPQVEPFYNNIEGFTWWQIPHNNQTMYRSYMPFILYVDSLKEPADYERVKMLESISLNRHHIFGVLYDEDKNAKTYAYGILARNTPAEQPYEGATGFKTWHPCDPEPHDLHSYGYWILKVDPKTGEVIKD